MAVTYVKLFTNEVLDRLVEDMNAFFTEEGYVRLPRQFAFSSAATSTGRSVYAAMVHYTDEVSETTKQFMSFVTQNPDEAQAWLSEKINTGGNLVDSFAGHAVMISGHGQVSYHVFLYREYVPCS